MFLIKPQDPPITGGYSIHPYVICPTHKIKFGGTFGILWRWLHHDLWGDGQWCNLTFVSHQSQQWALCFSHSHARPETFLYSLLFKFSQIVKRLFIVYSCFIRRRRRRVGRKIKKTNELDWHDGRTARVSVDRGRKRSQWGKPTTQVFVAKRLSHTHHWH